MTEIYARCELSSPLQETFFLCLLKFNCAGALIPVGAENNQETQQLSTPRTHFNVITWPRSLVFTVGEFWGNACCLHAASSAWFSPQLLTARLGPPPARSWCWVSLRKQSKNKEVEWKVQGAMRTFIWFERFIEHLDSLWRDINMSTYSSTPLNACEWSWFPIFRQATQELPELSEVPQTCNKLGSCHFSGCKEVIHGALLRHRLQVQPPPVVAIVQLTGVALRRSGDKGSQIQTHSIDTATVSCGRLDSQDCPASKPWTVSTQQDTTLICLHSLGTWMWGGDIHSSASPSSAHSHLLMVTTKVKERKCPGP